MNSFLKANPLILSFLIIIGLGATNEVSAQITSTSATICEGETATVTAANFIGTVEWHTESNNGNPQPDLATLVGTGPSFTTPALSQTTNYYAVDVVAGFIVSEATSVITVNPSPDVLTLLGSEFQCLTGLFAGNISGTAPSGITGIINYHDGPFLTDPILQTDNFPIDSSTAYFIGPHPFVTAGLYAISVVAEDPVTGCQSAPTAFFAEFIDPPAAPVVSGNASVCEGESTTLNAPGSGGTITWYSDAGLVTVVATGSQFTTPALTVNPTSYWVTETDTRPDQGCESLPTQVDITVNPLPADPVGTGDTICSGETAELSAAGGGTLNWYSDPSGADLVGTGATFTTPSLNQTTTYYVQSDDGTCVSALVPVTAIVNQRPGQLDISADEFQCLVESNIGLVAGNFPIGTIATFNFHDGNSIDDPVLVTYTVAYDSTNAYTVGPHPFVTPGQYAVSGVAIDPVTGCAGVPSAILVNVVDVPAAPAVTGDTVLCSGETTILNAPGTGGSITWYSDAGLTTVVATGSQFITPVLTTDPTSYWVTESDPRTSEPCESAATQVNITVNPSPADPVGTNDTICAGETASLEAVGGGGTLNWYSDPSGTILVGTGSPFITQPLLGNTTFYVQEDDDTCTSNLVPVTAVVNTLPTAPEVDDVLIACEFDSMVTVSFIVSDEQLGFLFNILAIEAASGDTVVNLTDLGPITEIGTQVVTMGPITVFPFGDHYIISTITDPSSGCVSVPDISILSVVPGPEAPLVLDTVEVCEGETATIFAFGDFDSTSYVTWYDEPAFDPIAFGWEYETQPMFFDQTFYASVTNEEGCEGPLAAVTIVVNPKPADPVVTDDTVCVGEMATLTVSGAGGTYTWYSDGAGTNPLATGDTYITPVLAQTTVFYVQETDAEGCMSDIIGVTAFATPLPDAPQGVGTILCVGETGEISATGSGSGVLTWYNSDQVPVQTDTMPPADATLSVGPFDAPGTYFFYVSENDGSCESELTEIEVLVGDTPLPPTVEGTTVCEGESATLTATGTGGTINWYSDLALTDLVAQGPSFTTGPLSPPDTSFWVTESFGSCESVGVEVEVTVNENPETPSISSNAPICEGEDLMLMTDFVPGATYMWAGPNGFTSADINPIVPNVTQALNQGMYTLTLMDAGTGCMSGTAEIFVEIFATPDAPSISSNSPVCSGDDVNLIAGDVAGATEYIWYQDGVPFDTTATGELTIPGAVLVGDTEFGVSVTVNGCISPIAVTLVVVNPIPEPVAVTSNSPVCEGDDIQLVAAVVSGASYSWTGPNGPISESGPIAVIEDADLDDAGTYSVTVIVNGCESAPSETEVEVLPQPQLPQNPTTNSPICEGDTLYLIAPFLEGVTYHWEGPVTSGFTSDEQSPIILNVSEVDNQGFYTLTVTDEETGCQSFYSVLVFINTFPDNIIADNNGPVCQGESFTLNVTSIVLGDNVTYTWTGPLNFDVTTTEPSVVVENAQPNMSGTYTVTIQLDDCASMQVSTDVVVYTKPLADAGPDLTIEEGTIFQLDGLGSIGAVDYLWSGEDPDYFDDPTSPNPIIGLNAPLEARDEPYVFVLQVWNEFGCTNTDTMLVFIFETQDLITPNVITPNGDGINDIWLIEYIDNLDNYVVSVYARGGTLVYKNEGDYNSFPFDGTYDGDDLPEGTYWYTIHHDGDQVYKGFIEILR